MTIKELIKELKKLPKDAVIVSSIEEQHNPPHRGSYKRAIVFTQFSHGKHTIGCKEDTVIMRVRYPYEPF